MSSHDTDSISPTEALERLREGNRRFRDGRGQDFRDLREARRALADGQQPFAVVLGCSDSRVPVEIVFNHSLGELFVIRVAGNIAAPSQIGSIEFAVEHLGARLVVVLGHAGCGAVAAALRLMDSGEAPGPETPHLATAVVDRVKASLGDLPEHDADARMREAIRQNVRYAAAAIPAGSPALRRKHEDGAIRIMGAEYSLERGTVEFL